MEAVTIWHLRRGQDETRQVIIVTHVRLFDWVDLERGEACTNIRWGDPFLAGDGSAGIRCSGILDAGQGEARKSGESEEKSDNRSERTCEHVLNAEDGRAPEPRVWWNWWRHSRPLEVTEPFCQPCSEAETSRVYITAITVSSLVQQAASAWLG